MKNKIKTAPNCIDAVTSDWLFWTILIQTGQSSSKTGQSQKIIINIQFHYYSLPEHQLLSFLF